MSSPQAGRLAERLQSLSPEKRALLERRLRDRGVHLDRSVILREAGGESTYPLSFSQERLWFLHQLEPDSPAYNLYSHSRLRGALRPRALERALEGLSRRHEVLRTTFEPADGSVRQRVHPPAGRRLPVVDLDRLGRTEAEETLRGLASRDSRTPFDLHRGPLLRAALTRLAADDHALLLSLHHVVADDWSMGILMAELITLYEAFAAGRPSPLPQLPVQYGDYARWQRSWLSGEVLDRQLDFWRETLAGAPAVLELPLDRPRPKVQSFRGAQEKLTLPSLRAERLRSWSRAQGATLFMTLLAGFAALLGRRAGARELCLGNAIAGRSRAEVEGLIGFFVNTLVLRLDLGGDPSFEDLVRRARRVVIEAQGHQELPFERLVQELQPERSLARSPLFQALVTLHPASPQGSGTSSGSGLEIAALDQGGGSAKFDLVLDLVPTVDSLTLQLDYCTDLFDATTVQRMVHQLGEILARAVADPRARLAELTSPPAAERHQLLAEWGTPAQFEQVSGCLHELVEAQAARTPEAVAVEQGTAKLTYGQLDEAANRLAHRLRSAGAGAESRVGLLMERRPEMVVAILGILKAGAAYVALEPALPAERRAFLLEDAGARLVVTSRRMLAEAPLLEVETVSVDEPWEGGPSHAASPPRRVASPSGLAYVLYTSGSSGRPKGVGVMHRTVARHVEVVARIWALGPEDRVLQFTSLSFDASLEQIFCPLAVGATAVLRPDELGTDEEFLGLLVAARITVANVPPIFWQRLAEASASAPEVIEGHRLRLMIVGGDLMRTEPASVWQRVWGAGLINAYGPTESIITAAWYRVPAAGPESPERSSIPLGWPVGGRSLRVLDRRLEAVPLGAHGELCAGGDWLARGYLGRPALTAERFVPDPWSAEPGGRLYRTGDLVRHLADGRVDFAGRIDHQVKILGQRVEPGEVEAVLEGCAEVAEAVVAVRRDAAGNRRLVAFLVAAPGVSPDLAALREHLRGVLTPAMMPSAFTALEELPLLPTSGKVDRLALPEVDFAAQTLEGELAAPRDQREELIAEIWAEVLGLERVGVHSSFFDLGGHSLLATRVLTRLREALGLELPLRILFEHPTVAGLALAAAEARWGAARPLPPLERLPRDGELLASFAQERLWFLQSLDPASTAYNLPAVLELEGDLDARALEAALGALVARHESLRTRLEQKDGRLLQVIDPPAAKLRLPVVDLERLAARERRLEARRLAGVAAGRPFDLGRDPMLRPALVRLGCEQHVGLLILHHAASDDWSAPILVREVAALYAACREAPDDPAAAADALPALPVQYADYAGWQRSWLAGERLETEVAFWRRRLDGVPPLLELPLDRPRPAVQTFAGATASRALPPPLAEALAAYARGAGATLFMVVLAAFETLLGRASGQRDFCVGTPIAGRGRVETEGLIGFFVNTLALRADLRGDPPFARFLVRTREEALEAFAHSELPFETLIEALSPSRSLAYTPLFQVTFQLLHRPRGEEAAVALPGLEVIPLGVETATSKFDLSLTATFGGGNSRAGTSGGSAGTLVLGLDHNTDLFDRTTAARLLGHLETLLEAVCGGDGERLSELPLLRSAERAQLLREWNDTETRAPAAAEAVHQLFERRAAEQPEALAVAAGGLELSYGRLDRWAGALARALRREGVGPEVLVALCARPGAGLVAGALAILKAGGAYLPLDPEQPPERLRTLLEDAWKHQPRPILLADAATAEALAGHGGIELRVEEPAAGEGVGQGELPLARVHGTNLAYAIYTSGSTGLPKRVLLTHQGLLNLVAWHLEAYGVTAADRATQLASPAFDASVWEIWPYLAAGASLHVPAEPETRLSPTRLQAWLEAERISLAFLSTPMTETLLREGPWPGTLRAALTGGDKLHTPSGALPAAAVVNHYGPTESTVVTTAGRVTAAAGSNPPIGRPIANLRAYVLSPRGFPVTAGVPGELYVGGAGPARGYDRQSALTAEKLVPDPLSGVPGARLYRTGDLVRWLADGSLEFLQRIDQQVKVRGFRIEPGEIEAALAAHPAVREVVVLTRDEPAGGKSLVAFLTVPVGEGPPEVAALRAFLAGRLPAYMVPARLAMVDALPLTPNGKVDRRALVALDAAAQTAPALSQAPRTDIEKVLAAMWAETLGIERVGVHDDFFELGGHSILATRLLARLEETFRFELSLRQLFEATTVDALAAALERLEPVPGQVEKIARVLLKIKAMSPEEKAARLGHRPEPVEAG